MTLTTNVPTTFPILSKGSTGDDVKHLQSRLNYIYGSELEIDGIFGEKTEAVLKKFQRDYGLVVDGIAGSQTWNRLETIYSTPVNPKPLPILSIGSQGRDVKYLQDLLKSLGYVLEADGIFGVKTEAAVKQFQEDYDLDIDGIVGAKTWSMLEYQIHS